MFTQKPVGPVTLLLLALMLSLCALDAAQAQERWPPWQSYGEAETNKRAQPKRRAKPTQNELDALNRQVAQLRKAGKLAEATSPPNGPCASPSSCTAPTVQRQPRR